MIKMSMSIIAGAYQKHLVDRVGRLSTHKRPKTKAKSQMHTRKPIFRISGAGSGILALF